MSLWYCCLKLLLELINAALFYKKLNLCTIMDAALFLVSLSLVVVLVAGEQSVSRTAYTHQQEMKVSTLYQY